MMNIYTYYISYDYSSNNGMKTGCGSLITTRSEIRTSEDIKQLINHISHKTRNDVIILKLITKLDATEEELQCFLQNSEGIEDEDNE